MHSGQHSEVTPMTLSEASPWHLGWWPGYCTSGYHGLSLGIWETCPNSIQIPILRVYHVANFYPSTSFTVPSSRNIQASPPVPARPLFRIVLISRGCRLPFRLWRLYLAARHGLQHMLQEVPVGPLHALELRITVATPEPQKLLEWNKQNVCLIHAYPTLWGTLPYHIIPPKRIEHSVQESNMSGEISPYLQYYP